MASGARDPAAWSAELVSAVVDGRPTPAAGAQLDSLLRWMASPDAPQVQPIAVELRRRGLPPPQARRLALMLLEEMLFAGAGGRAERVLGLEAGASPARIRSRYHLLMRVYHPDLAGEESAWLHERAERINRAYSRSCGRAGQGEPRASPPPVARRGARRRVPPRRSRWRGLRPVLGEAPVFRRRVLVALALACSALVVHTCVSDRAWERWMPDAGATADAGPAARTGRAVPL